MSDPSIFTQRRAVQVENDARMLPARGKMESQLLVILPGTAAATVNDIRHTGAADQIIQIRHFDAWKGSAIVTTLTIYPQDIVGGWDNFTGYGEPPLPFIQPWKAAPVVLLTNYGPYNPAGDILGHRAIDFKKEPDFNHAQRQYLLTALVIPPPPVGDLSTQIFKPQQFFEPPLWVSPNRGAWFIVLMPNIAPPPPQPPVPFPFIPNTATVDVRLNVGYQPWKVHLKDVIG